MSVNTRRFPVVLAIDMRHRSAGTAHLEPLRLIELMVKFPPAAFII